MSFEIGKTQKQSKYGNPRFDEPTHKQSIFFIYLALILVILVTWPDYLALVSYLVSYVGHLARLAEFNGEPGREDW